jgi:hypothetical protein
MKTDFKSISSSKFEEFYIEKLLSLSIVVEVFEEGLNQIKFCPMDGISVDFLVVKVRFQVILNFGRHFEL